MASAGIRDTYITIQTASFQKVDGVPTEVWSRDRALWGNVEYRQSQEEQQGGVSVRVETVRLRFDWMDAQSLNEGCRFVIRGKSYEARSFDWDTDFRQQVIVDAAGIATDPGSVRSEWERKMRAGEIVRIQDRTQDPIRETYVRAVSETLQPDELVSGLTQGARRYFVMADDVDEDFGPIRRGQYVRIRDDRLFIENVDDATYRIAGDLIVYVLLTRGMTDGKA